MKRKKQVRFRAYDLIERAVEEGISLGWTRMHKYAADPSEDATKEFLRLAIMETLDEVLALED